MKTSENLKEILERIDRRGYPAYKDIRGSYQFSGYILNIDHVQGDPFASPSKVSVKISGKVSAFPKNLYENAERKTALEDELLRQFGFQAGSAAFKAKGSGKSGLISVSHPGAEVLERSSCEIDPDHGDLLLRMDVGLPANGRSINAREAVKIFFELIPSCVGKSLYYSSLKSERLEAIAQLADNQAYIRRMLFEKGLCAFVADGSVLPRESGISQKPMKDAIPFRTPESFAVTMEVPYGGTLRGMGIPKGVTLIVGGGYHGKSTLLEALERGVYNHVLGDGREYVLTDSSAVKIRAEDGRSIRDVDISMFINGLPNGKNTEHFDTEDASGSTSQAANVIEAMEAGSSVFLIDEDTSATNFMIRDELMQLVVGRDSEPITPYIDRLRELYNEHGISSIIVAGSSGSFFHEADHILQMRQYIPEDITDFAREMAGKYPLKSERPHYGKIPSFDRKPVSEPKRPVNNRERSTERVKIKVFGRDSIQVQRETIDLRYVEQLVDSEQLMALGYFLNYAYKHFVDGKHSMIQIVDELMHTIEKKGMRSVCESGYLPAGLAMPRRQEIFACFNRYRKLNTKWNY